MVKFFNKPTMIPLKAPPKLPTSSGLLLFVSVSVANATLQHLMDRVSKNISLKPIPSKMNLSSYKR